MLKVLVVGPSTEKSKGGMTTVIRGMQEDPWLTDRFAIDTFGSYVDGNPAKRLLHSVAAFRQFKKICQNYDVIHIHMASYGSTFRKGHYVRYAKKLGKRVILHVHGGKYLVFYQGLSERKKKIVQSIWNAAEAVVVLSERWKADFSKVFHHPNLVVIQNGIDIAALSAGQCDVAQNRNAFLVLARLSKAKGVYDIISAVSRLKQTHPQIRVYMAGNGELEQLRAKIAQEGLQDNIQLVGWVDAEQKTALLQKSATILLPSYNEALPMCILEGMAAGKVVVASKVGAIPEVVIPEENGLLMQAGDVDALANAMQRVMDDPQFCLRCAQANAQKMEQTYNRAVMHRKLANLFNAK